VRVLVTGSRDWPDINVVWSRLDTLYGTCARDEDFVVVHGDCPTGADRQAREWCEVMHDKPVDPYPRVVEERHPAHWRTLGVLDRGAGFRRNAEMVAAGADWVLAFIKDGSRGATHTHDLAVKAGIRIHLDTLTSIGGSNT
jgi:hypothetical protein